MVITAPPVGAGAIAIRSSCCRWWPRRVCGGDRGWRGPACRRSTMPPSGRPGAMKPRRRGAERRSGSPQRRRMPTRRRACRPRAPSHRVRPVRDLGQRGGRALVRCPGRWPAHQRRHAVAVRALCRVAGGALGSCRKCGLRGSAGPQAPPGGWPSFSIPGRWWWRPCAGGPARPPIGTAAPGGAVRLSDAESIAPSTATFTSRRERLPSPPVGAGKARCSSSCCASTTRNRAVLIDGVDAARADPPPFASVSP
jgi:hypothetical protein